MTDTNDADEIDIGEDLDIQQVNRRTISGGAWVWGSIAECRFDALVFKEHAQNAEWEIGDSRISKLWIQRKTDKKTVYNWDWGWKTNGKTPAATIYAAMLRESVKLGDKSRFARGEVRGQFYATGNA